MSDISSNNKRIAKNTLLLYLRTLLMMFINLYTSRVVLNVLGVTDYGIYNVVGGVISMLSFLTGALGAASSRYITFDLGKGDMTVMKKTFGNILSIYFIIACIFLLVGETIGLWFVLNKLQIPEDRTIAALWVYQFSVFSSIIGVISVPYNATIIAHEKMKAFAYMGIIDAVLKLLIVYLLMVISYDKLIIYAALFFCVQMFDRLVYGIYCTKNFKETRTRWQFNKRVFKDIFNFAAWAMMGNLAAVGYSQGVNILLNIFFGPAVNAARGIAVQVQSAIQTFCSNFQMALNPQLTKSYAKNDMLHMHQLLTVSSKFSFFLLFLLSLPLILEAPLVLKWWLGIVPEHTVNFLRLILCAVIINTLANPLIVSVHAVGDIGRFHLVEGTMLLCIVPIAYLLLKLFGIAPEYVFCVHIVVEICTQYARMRIALPMISMQQGIYVKKVLIPILKVVILASIIPFIIYLSVNQTIVTFFIVCVISVLSVFVSVYFLGCTKREQTLLKEKVYNVILRIKK